jgi:hypothetical protein
MRESTGICSGSLKVLQLQMQTSMIILQDSTLDLIHCLLMC